MLGFAVLAWYRAGAGTVPSKMAKTDPHCPTKAKLLAFALLQPHLFLTGRENSPADVTVSKS